MSSTVTDPPDGWTVNDDEMDREVHWGANGDGTNIAKSLGITNPVPAMVKSVNAGADAYVFTAGQNVYLWNMVSNDVFQYTNPTSLSAILAEMRKVGSKRKVEMKLLPEDDV
ncbi:hypothetical protein CDD81_5960 [Ophiocordyceps australis]|uniref:Uncharacterized protein n=1 Tax=Ophiocordyceps australis TaxID=1399860 RepID=A0A2C5XM66_9HYPO|nr:hypothetical protein CDD81_5960 [Ophiocordyceps australis]